MRVLVVDDNELARRIVKDVVVDQGWQVCGEAANGQEAIDLIRSEQPDLVILDFMMRVKDGLQTAREILQMKPTVPIVLNTLYCTDQLRAVAEEIGVRRVVSKSNYKVLREVLDAF